MKLARLYQSEQDTWYISRKQPEHTKSRASRDDVQREVRASGVGRMVDHRAMHVCSVWLFFEVVLASDLGNSQTIGSVHERDVNDEVDT